MSDYIKREDAIDALYEECNKDQSLSCPYQFFDGIDRIPAADVRENVHGEWKTAMLDHEAFGVRPKVIYCSSCCQATAYKTKFCPNCGARMDGGKEK